MRNLRSRIQAYFLNRRNVVLDPVDGMSMGEPRSQKIVRGLLPVAVAVLLVAGFLTIAWNQPATVTAAPAAVTVSTCDRAALMNQRLDELGRGGYAWSIVVAPLASGNKAETLIDEREVQISPTAPCELIITIVSHEWMHVQQGRKYPSNEELFRAVGEFEVEMVADCGSMLLGSAYLPYITRHRQETGERGCSAYELGAAQQLIDNAAPVG